MKSRSGSGLHRQYSLDPEGVDHRPAKRRFNRISRRGFLKGSGLTVMSSAVVSVLPFTHQFAGRLLPAALAQSGQPSQIEGKDGLIVLNERPLNAEVPAHLLDDKVTPASRLFVRNNGIPPSIKGIDVDDWTLEITGESCLRSSQVTLGRLKREFRHHTYQLLLECAGNGRSEFNPPALGNQWTVGGVGCPRWTGVRLRDVLMKYGLRKDAVYIGYYGADTHISGNRLGVPISRGMPISKAMEEETLLAWAMNDEEIPLLHGFPLRLVVGGWPASVSGKWLTKLVVRNRIHDGPKMLGQSYRVPCNPVAAGTKVPDSDMCIIESMPVKSILTCPKSGLVHPRGKVLRVRGKAWAGDLEVNQVFVSIDFGATWRQTALSRPANRLSWQSFEAELTFPSAGYFEIWARAVDSQGQSQPMVLPGWNPRGYLNNACHRIAIQVSG